MDYNICCSKYLYDYYRASNPYYLPTLTEKGEKKHFKTIDYSVIFRERNLVNTAGFPTKLGTSLSHGVAVLATAVGDIPIYIGNGVNGFILPQRKEDLIVFLNHLPSMPYPEVDCNALYWGKYIANLSGIREY